MATQQQAEILEQILEKLHERIDGIEELVVLHRDGTLLGTFRPASAISEHVTQAVPHFADLTDEICLALEQGVSTEVVMKGTERFMAMYKAAECNIFLAVVGKKGVNFGLLSSGCRRALEAIREVFRE